MQAVGFTLSLATARTKRVIKRKESKVKNSIIDQAKSEVKAKREPKVIQVKTLVSFIATVLISLAIGAFVGITISNAINSNIDNQVKAKVEAQLKSNG